MTVEEETNRRRKTIRFFALLIILLSLFQLALPQNEAPHNQRALTDPASPLVAAQIAGSQATLVVLVRFSDVSNTTSPSKIFQLINGLNAYYAEDSYGLVSFVTTVSPILSEWYSLPHDMGYYSSGTVAIDNQLVSDSLQAAYNAGINFHNYKFAMVVHSGSDEAITHSSTDIHSFTLPGYVFNPTPLNSFQISTSVVSEADPVGVYCHEAGHLLGLPDLYDLTQQIDPTNDFVGYWEIMALGEWNPNNGNPLQPPPGTYPSQHSSWSKLSLGWIPDSSTKWVYPGNLTTVTLQNLELPTDGIQAVKIPIGVNSDGSLSYYLVEMRAKLGTYDSYLPFPSDYPGAALLVYKVNASIPTGYGNLRLVDAHPGGDLSDAGFGPCFPPCVSNNTFSDPANFVKIIVTNTNFTAFTIVVDRTSSPLLLLQVDTPGPGIIVSVDGTTSTSDGSNQLRLPVHYGPHEIYVQAEVPVSFGPSSIQVGLADSFAAWDDGSTSNPRWISVIGDTVLTATYRVVVQPSFATAVTAALILGVVSAGLAFNRTNRRKPSTAGTEERYYADRPEPNEEPIPRLLPGNDSLRGDTIGSDEKPDNSQT